MKRELYQEEYYCGTLIIHNKSKLFISKNFPSFSAVIFLGATHPREDDGDLLVL